MNIEHLLQSGFAMMDGIQLRWLRSPGQNLNTMWADCEDVLMPLPPVGGISLIGAVARHPTGVPDVGEVPWVET